MNTDSRLIQTCVLVPTESLLISLRDNTVKMDSASSTDPFITDQLSGPKTTYSKLSAAYRKSVYTGRRRYACVYCVRDVYMVSLTQPT